MGNFSYIEIGLIVILTLTVLSIITFYKKKKREKQLNDGNDDSTTVFIDDKEHLELTGFKAQKQNKSKTYNLVLKYFQDYQMLIEEIRIIKVSDLTNLERISHIKNLINTNNSKLKTTEEKLVKILKDNELKDLLEQLHNITAPFCKRSLRKIMEFENLQLELNKLLPNGNQAKIDSIRVEQRTKYQDYSQQKLDYFENRKDIYKKFVYRIANNYQIE